MRESKLSQCLLVEAETDAFHDVGLSWMDHIIRPFLSLGLQRAAKCRPQLKLSSERLIFENV